MSNKNQNNFLGMPKNYKLVEHRKNFKKKYIKKPPKYKLIRGM